MKTTSGYTTTSLAKRAISVVVLTLTIVLAFAYLGSATAYAEVEGETGTQSTQPDPLDLDAYADWLIALGDQYVLDNYDALSGDESEQSYADIVLGNFEGDIHKTAAILRATILLQHAIDQSREPTAKEKAYVASMQMLVFGEASPYYSQTDATGSDGFSTLSSGGNYNYTGPYTGTYPSAAADGTFRKGLILVTNDRAAGLVPTGHAAILYSAANDTAMSSFPQFVSRNNPQQEGVQTEPNDWYRSHATCFVLKSNVTTAAQDAAVADWCYRQYGKKYSIAFWTPSLRSEFYCSQLVWAGFLDLYGINIGNADSESSTWQAAIYPMELKWAPQTSLLYRHGTTDTGWQPVNGHWYYIDDNGSPATDRWQPDSTSRGYLGSDGKAIVSRWHEIGGYWYYLDDDGHPYTNRWQVDSTSRGYLGPDGKAIASSWYKIGGSWYCFDSEGHPYVNCWRPDSVSRGYLGPDGKAIVSSWYKIGGYWYYFDTNGNPYTNRWQADSTSRGYLGPDGRAVVSSWYKIGGYWYYFNSDGHPLKGWQRLRETDGYNYWFYFDATSDYMYANRVQADSGGNCYLKANGHAAISEYVIISGVSRYVNSAGHIQ